MRRLYFVPLMLLLAVPAPAQTVINPRALEFFASPDHAVTLPTGQAMVDHYEFQVFTVGASQPFQTQTIGKPTPATGTNLCHVDIAAVILALPLSGTQEWFARVAALGPSGSGVSGDSNRFLAAPPPRAPSGAVVLLP